MAFTKNIKQLGEFLGLIGYYRRFVSEYDTICKPLTQLLKKKIFSLNEKVIRAFKLLKESMTKPLVLTLPNLNKPFIRETDTLEISIGVVLMHEGHPIAFISKFLGS
jgi:hypothetical protein